MTGRGLPEGRPWYTAPIVGILLISIGGAVGWYITRVERDIFPRRALLSPTKLYHNSVPYIMYAYLGGLPLVACLASGTWSRERWWLVLAGVSIAVWGVFALLDSALRERSRAKAGYAHPADWRPAWAVRD